MGSEMCIRDRDYIKRISGGDTVGYLTTRIQAQIDHNKTAKAAQQ